MKKIMSFISGFTACNPNGSGINDTTYCTVRNLVCCLFSMLVRNMQGNRTPTLDNQCGLLLVHTPAPPCTSSILI
ncbi:MAG: hypothetical protein ACRC4N_02395, partial [Gammaproteobacteria bacterium]